MMSPQAGYAGQNAAAMPSVQQKDVSRLEQVGNQIDYLSNQLSSINHRLARFADRMTGAQPEAVESGRGINQLGTPTPRAVVVGLEDAANGMATTVERIFAAIERIERI